MTQYDTSKFPEFEKDWIATREEITIAAAAVKAAQDAVSQSISAQVADPAEYVNQRTLADEKLQKAESKLDAVKRTLQGQFRETISLKGMVLPDHLRELFKQNH